MPSREPAYELINSDEDGNDSSAVLLKTRRNGLFRGALDFLKKHPWCSAFGLFLVLFVLAVLFLNL